MSKTSQTPVRIAFVGAGGITAGHRIAFEEHPDLVRVAAVADPVLAAAQNLATPFNVPAFTDPAAMLDTMKGKVDAVLVSTPHNLHFPHAKLALTHGLPVLVEKPATCTLEDFRELQALEKKHGVFAQVGQKQRFGRQEIWIKNWLNSEAFGEPRLINLDIYQNIQGYVSDKADPWILDKNRAGGGVVISVGVHILDLVRFWFDDDYVEVTAHGRFDPPMLNGAESCCVALLKTRRGMIGSLNCSYTVARCPYSQRSLLFGTRGTLVQHLEKIGSASAGPFYLSTDGGKPSPEWNMMFSGFESVAEIMAREPAFAEPAHHAQAFISQILSFAESVKTGRATENSLERNFNTLALIDAIGRSIVSGQTEKVATE